MMGSVKSSGLSLLLLSYLLYIVNSYPNSDISNTGCGECALRRNDLFSTAQKPVYQCRGCCFSRAYPTPLRSKNTMTVIKNITSEATCCVAKSSNDAQLQIPNVRVRNHTACHCSTCYHHKQ